MPYADGVKAVVLLATARHSNCALLHKTQPDQYRRRVAVHPAGSRGRERRTGRRNASGLVTRSAVDRFLPIRCTTRAVITLGAPSPGTWPRRVSTSGSETLTRPRFTLARIRDRGASRAWLPTRAPTPPTRYSSAAEVALPRVGQRDRGRRQVHARRSRVTGPCRRRRPFRGLRRAQRECGRRALLGGRRGPHRAADRAVGQGTR